MAMPRSKFKKFTVEIQVHQTWIDDGFDINKKNVKEVMRSLLPFATENEVKAKLLPNLEK